MDMIKPVAARSVSVNNALKIAQSAQLTQIKLNYYRMFAWLYRQCGQFPQLIFANSSWTRRHIGDLWFDGHVPIKCRLLYPPCDVDDTVHEDPIHTRECHVVSVAQFRPEKRLTFQLQILKNLIEKHRDMVDTMGLKWLFVGSCRNSGDIERANELRNIAVDWDLDKYVEFHINVSHDDLKRIMQEALIGIHTMIEEHFGIAIVECMNAGLLMVANKSGGPQMDIIKNGLNGFCADSVDEYVDAIVQILQMTNEHRDQVKAKAKLSIERFRSNHFRREFELALIQLTQL